MGVEFPYGVTCLTCASGLNIEVIGTAWTDTGDTVPPTPKWQRLLVGLVSSSSPSVEIGFYPSANFLKHAECW